MSGKWIIEIRAKRRTGDPTGSSKAVQRCKELSSKRRASEV
jgi:hypothetical protein